MVVLLTSFHVLSPVGAAQTSEPVSKEDRDDGSRSFRRRGDIRSLPAPLKERLVQIARRPHSYLPITAFSEADEPSRLFMYSLLDTTGFQPNVFTAKIPGINDTAIPTAANAANGGLPTPTAFNRFTITREVNDGLLAPRFAPSQRAYVASGHIVLVQPSVPASVPRDADDR